MMERKEVKELAELEVRRYFDHYLERVFPQQVKAFIKEHNLDPKAHGGVERRFSKLTWVMLGAAAVGGGGITKLITIAFH